LIYIAHRRVLLINSNSHNEDFYSPHRQKTEKYNTKKLTILSKNDNSIGKQFSSNLSTDLINMSYLYFQLYYLYNR